jgi:hypothetical protein
MSQLIQDIFLISPPPEKTFKQRFKRRDDACDSFEERNEINRVRRQNRFQENRGPPIN